MQLRLTQKVYCFLLLFATCFFCKSSAQSITPATLNIGGGTFANNSFKLDWNIGEATVIETFVLGTNYTITNGVLQPLTTTGITAINSVPEWLKNELQLFPIPSARFINVNVVSGLSGKIVMELLDNRLRQLGKKEFDYYGINTTKQWDMAAYTSGTYFIKITLVAPDQKVLKRGSFMVQKIN